LGNALETLAAMLDLAAKSESLSSAEKVKFGATANLGIENASSFKYEHYDYFPGTSL